MSIRTIIEINHDALHELREHPERVDEFLHLLGCQNPRDMAQIPAGIRVLAQRHHSDKVVITVQ